LGKLVIPVLLIEDLRGVAIGKKQQAFV